MRFIIVLALALCLGFAYGADLSRSKRDMQQEMQNIIQDIQKNGIGAVGNRINEFVKNFQGQLQSWHCPNINDYFQTLQSGDAGKIAQMLFTGAVCVALGLYGRQ